MIFYKKQLLRQVTSVFCNELRATSEFTTSNERISLRVTSDFTKNNEQRVNLQQVTTDFLQQATSATSKEPILQQVTSDFATSNEQRVNLQQVTTEFHNE